MDFALRDSELVLIGHGSTVNDQSAEAILNNAQQLRLRELFAGVHCAFWKQEPFVKDLAASLPPRRVFFVPMFISEGYFSERVIPEVLGFRNQACETWSRVRNVNGHDWLYCKPVGTDTLMTELILDRATTVVSKFPFPRAPKSAEISLFIVGHGTEQDPASRNAVQAQCELISKRNLYAQVEPLFLEEKPFVKEMFELAQKKHVVVVPFFISEGLHVQEDIPVMLGEPERFVQQRLEKQQNPWRNPTERKGKLIWYTPGVGSDPKMPEVILARVKESLASTKRHS